MENYRVIDRTNSIIYLLWLIYALTLSGVRRFFILLILVLTVAEWQLTTITIVLNNRFDNTYGIKYPRWGLQSVMKCA